jgi:DNA repair protein RadA/Sms
MAARTLYRCVECDAETPKWMGRCTACGAWDSLTEVLPAEKASVLSLVGAPAGPPRTSAVPIDQIAVPAFEHLSTGVPELDRVLGGGLVAGSVTLLAGEPGIGKSTLTLQLANGLASGGRSVLVISGEESPQQVRLRAQRLGTLRPRVYLAGEHDLGQVLAHIEELSPDAVVLDSIQTVSSPELPGSAGSVSQVAGCASRLIAEAKQRDLPVVLVGHVTKEGSLAGPRALEHLVDTVLTFEGDRHHALRLLRAVKHRFGPTDEVGVMEMTGTGLATVTDPSSMFLADRRPGTPGSVVVPAVEGHRPVLVEVQALTVGTNMANPRRSAQGLDTGRLSMVLAVLLRHGGILTHQQDVYALAVGGAKVVEPACDLGLAMAVASSATDVPLRADVVVCGELGLGGEVRHIPRVERRLQEASRLGFTRALVPPASPRVEGIEVVEVACIAEALDWAAIPRQRRGQ